jgi:MFS family permease
MTGPLARRNGNYKWWVLATAIFGAFVSILDTTIVNIALPHIQRAFGSDLHVASYLTTAYTLAQGVIIAASGFLANRFGIKRVYLLSLALFTLGSVTFLRILFVFLSQNFSRCFSQTARRAASLKKVAASFSRITFPGHVCRFVFGKRYHMVVVSHITFRLLLRRPSITTRLYQRRVCNWARSPLR